MAIHQALHTLPMEPRIAGIQQGRWRGQQNNNQPRKIFIRSEKPGLELPSAIPDSLGAPGGLSHVIGIALGGLGAPQIVATWCQLRLPQTEEVGGSHLIHARPRALQIFPSPPQRLGDVFHFMLLCPLSLSPT